jgi:hypothetical protein
MTTDYPGPSARYTPSVWRMEPLETAGQLDAAVFEYRRILALPQPDRESPSTRRGAVAVARELARVTRALHVQADERSPSRRALEALRALQYGFVALAQDPIDAPTVLGGEELDAVLLRGDVARWMRDALHGDAPA